MAWTLARMAILGVGAIAAGGTWLTNVAIAAPPAPPIPKPAAPSFVDQLKLNDQQKQKIATLRKTRNQEIAKLLTADQRKKLIQAMKSGNKLSGALKSLNLNADQKKKIAAIAQKSMQDIKGVLTADQKKQLEAYLKQQKANSSPVPVE